MTLPQNAKDALSRVQMMADSESEWADINLADWQTIRAHLMSQEAEISELRQGYWDARAVMGFDNGGDPTPRAVTSSFAAMMKSDAESMRRDYDESLRESDSAESRLAAANAQLRLMHRVLSQAVCVACADDGSAKDHELDKLEGVLRDQGWITSAVVPSTPTDEHLQGAGDEV